MRITRTLLVATGLLLSITELSAQTKRHTHGEATLDIAIEGRSGTLEFRAPAEDLYGFEREPRNAAERARRDSAFVALRTGALTMVQFDASLGCTLTASSVGAVEDKGGHGDVLARYSLACRVAPAGKPIAFGFSKAFPGVRSVKVQLLSDTKQVGLTVVNDKGNATP